MFNKDLNQCLKSSDHDPNGWNRIMMMMSNTRMPRITAAFTTCASVALSEPGAAPRSASNSVQSRERYRFGDAREDPCDENDAKKLPEAPPPSIPVRGAVQSRAVLVIETMVSAHLPVSESTKSTQT
eukprot:765317-Rhodomonas_salina.2